MADGAMVCPACGKGAGATAAAAPAGTTGGLADNVAGLLAYITIIPSIIFLVIEPYNKNRFIRFHSFQCLFLFVACFALGMVLMILGMIPFVGLLMVPISILIWIGVFVLVIVLAIKAYQGQMFKLPVIGDMAEKQANAV